MWYKNIDKLIKAVQNLRAEDDLPVNLIYSTPSCYLKALNEYDEENGVDWDSKSDDFFPYASDPHAYWSGYFSSRPTSKRLMHEGSHILQATRQMASAMHQKVRN